MPKIPLILFGSAVWPPSESDTYVIHAGKSIALEQNEAPCCATIRLFSFVWSINLWFFPKNNLIPVPLPVPVNDGVVIGIGILRAGTEDLIDEKYEHHPIRDPANQRPCGSTAWPQNTGPSGSCRDPYPEGGWEILVLGVMALSRYRFSPVSLFCLMASREFSKRIAIHNAPLKMLARQEVV